MVGKNDHDRQWEIWHEEDEPDANGSGRRWTLLCSICLRELEAAVNFPKHGLRICYHCIGEIHEATINNQTRAENSAGPNGSIKG